MNTANALGAFKSKCREKFGDNKFLGINIIVVLIRKLYLSPLIIKRFLQNRSPLTSMLISSDQHINMLRPREYFPPSRRVLRWSPSAAAPGHQKRAYTERGNTIAKSRLAPICIMTIRICTLKKEALSLQTKKDESWKPFIPIHRKHGFWQPVPRLWPRPPRLY